MNEQHKKYFSNWIGTFFLLPVIVYLILHIGDFLFVDYLNLLIHEGGHGVFKIFGRFIYTLGGTLMQIIIPSMFVVYYFVTRKKFLTQVFLIWLGENFFNISVYASDARSKKLLLLGGSKVYHDWNYLLSKTGLLEYDLLIGKVFIALGLISFLLGLFIPIIIKNEKPVNLDLSL